MIHELGFNLGIQLMVGLPGDNYERDIETVQAAIRLAAQMVRIYPTLVIAGTELDRRWEEGKYQALTMEEAIRICKDMLLYFSAAGIPVIRMGLYPGEELRSAGVIKAGPFHPAFGELVEQAIFRDQACLAIQIYWQHNASGKSICLYVQERDLSKMLGKNSSNLTYLRQALALQELQIKTCSDESRNWIGINHVGAEEEWFRLTREEYIKEAGIAA